MKKKNIKIKHRKYSLYQRKKSKGRKFLTGLLMVILVAGLRTGLRSGQATGGVLL